MIAVGAAQSAEHVKPHILAVFGLPRQTPTPCHPVKPVGAVIEGDSVTTCAVAGAIGNSMITIATTSMHHRCATCAIITTTYHYQTDSATKAFACVAALQLLSERFHIKRISLPGIAGGFTRQ
jgi:hypothetical protein